MPWVRVSDDFMDHDRFEDLSLDAIGLWLTGLAWSNRNLKDGRITRSKVRTLHAEVSDETVSELVRAGLWIERARHIEIRDYLDYQKDAETIRKEREMARQRKARSRRKVDEPPPELEQLPPDHADFGG